MSHRRKLFIAVVVVMLALAAVWVAMMSLGPSNDVDAYRKTLIAKGEKLEISEVLPPPVLPEQNGVDVVNQAFGLLTLADDDSSNVPCPMRMVAPGKAILCFAQPDVRGDDFTNSWSNVTHVVEADRPAMELLRQAAIYPALDFRLDYEGAETLLSHLAPMERCAQRLSAEAICDLHRGDTASATTNLCALLGLANSWRGERILISQAVRIEMTATAAEVSWELWQSTNVNDAELAMLETNWEKLEYVHPMENAFLMELAGNESTMEKMRASNEFLNHYIVGWPGGSGGGDIWDKLKLAESKFMWRVSWSYSDELQMLHNQEIILDTIRTIETNGIFDPAYSKMMDQPRADELTNALPDYRWAFSGGVLEWRSYLSDIMAAEATRQLVITAIALKRYQLKHGNYPANLNSLVPEFVMTVPIDPVDGKPLRYRPEKDGTFLLYSIGNNGIDDGGDGSLEKGQEGYPDNYWLEPNTLDLVWPQPMTAAEIEYFYAHPPK